MATSSSWNDPASSGFTTNQLWRRWRPANSTSKRMFSGLSAGTDLSWVKRTNPALHRQWDAQLSLFRAGVPNAGYPVRKFGYMQVGRVSDTATDAVAVGQMVGMTYGHRSSYRADAVVDRLVCLPPELDPVLEFMPPTWVPFALTVCCTPPQISCGTDVRSLGDGVRGRRVVIVGAGVIGLLTAMFAHHHGAASGVVLDPTPMRRRVAEQLGFEALDPTGVDPAVLLKTR